MLMLMILIGCVNGGGKVGVIKHNPHRILKCSLNNLQSFDLVYLLIEQRQFSELCNFKKSNKTEWGKFS